MDLISAIPSKNYTTIFRILHFTLRFIIYYVTILSFNPNNLGDLLCLETPDPNLNELPSPQRLRRKILVKAKRQMTTEDAVTGLTAASEPQLQPSARPPQILNEASIPLFLDGATTDARGDSKEENRMYTTKTTTTSKSIKLKKMQPRTRNLSVPLSRSKSEKNNNAKGIRIEMIL